MKSERAPPGFDWSDLGRIAPTSLVGARYLAHFAVQWATKAARANLAAATDDSHSSLAWDERIGALVSQPLPTRDGALTVGVRIDGLRLIASVDGNAPNEFALGAQTDSAAGAWVESVLRASGLAPASTVSLPYTIASHPVASGGVYDVRSEADALEELARWFRAAGAALEDVRAALAGRTPGPTPVLCWPHHFDIATVVRLEDGDSAQARAVGIGVSPGDEFYSQPYAYISPSPPPPAMDLPSLPQPGRWHTRGFVGVVVTGEEILRLPGRRQAFHTCLLETFGICRALLGA